MRRCTRCLVSKPDACFVDFTHHNTRDVVGEIQGVRREWCLQCRHAGKLLRPEPRARDLSIPRSEEDEARAKLAQEELQRFRARGAPIIPRAYVKRPTGRVLRRKSPKFSLS